MGFWNNRRDRWAKRALDRLWAAQAPPWSPGLGPTELSEALSEASAVKRHYADLVEADAALKRALGLDETPRLSAADRELLGLDPEEEDADAPPPTLIDFEARVHTYLAEGQAQETGPQRLVWPVTGFVLALAGAAAIVLLLLNARAVDQALVQADRDDEWTIRGAGDADPPIPIEVGALCLRPEPPQVRPAADAAGALRCRLSESLQVTLTHPEASTWSVGVFAAFPGHDPLPYGPTPASEAALALQETPRQQPVGSPRRLAVNHAPGAGWLVVVGTREPLGYTSLERAMRAWSATTAEHTDATAPELERRVHRPIAQALGQPLAFVRVTPLIIEPAEETPP